MKIRPVGAELFHADKRTDGRTDGRTDMTKLIASSRVSARLLKATAHLENSYMLPISFLMQSVFTSN